MISLKRFISKLFDFRLCSFKVMLANCLRFVQSTAWKLQLLADPPQAIAESAFVAPSTNMASNDTRKNYTDYQETAQWLGGTDFPRKLLSSLGISGTGPSAAGLSMLDIQCLALCPACLTCLSWCALPHSEAGRKQSSSIPRSMMGHGRGQLWKL